MAPKAPSRDAFAAVAALAALAAVVADPAGAAEIACRESHDYVVEIDGEYPPDARFYETDANGKFLVDIPSSSKSVLIDLPAGRAIPVPRTSLRSETIDGTIRVREPGGFDTPASKLAIEDAVVAFQIDNSRVRVMKPAGSPLVARSIGEKTTAADGSPAMPCLRIEPRPAIGIPGCAKWVYIGNTCDQRVVADLRRTEHLFSGTLPQTFSVVVPPVSEQSLGCAWWSGSMAPTEHELLAARFLDSPTGPGTRNHRRSTRH